MRVFSDLWKDLRYGIRLLGRSPLFTTVAALSLALGIGGAATVFTLVNAIVLRNLPVPDPSQLFVAERYRDGQPALPRFSWPYFERARDEVKDRAELAAATNSAGAQIAVGGSPGRPATPERGDIQLVSGEYFDVLRQQPQLGRLLTPADNVSVAGHPVAVVSDGFWRRRLGAAPNAVGREIRINGSVFTVVGVAAPSFFGATIGVRNPDAWLPVMMQSTVRYSSNVHVFDEGDDRKPFPPQPAIEWLNIIGRVPDPSQAPAIAAALDVLHRRERQQRPSYQNSPPEERRRFDAETIALDPAGRGLSSNLRRTASTPLFVLLAMVGVLLAIACGNVASLLLARSASRQREMAIRLSMGAGRARVVRQLLAESVVLAGLGGVAGLVLARWGSDLLLRLMTGATTVVDLNTSFDWRVLGFAIAVSVLTGLLFGLAPALRATRVEIVETLKLEARSVGAEGGRRGLPLGKVLVAAQIAFCLLLLVVAGLFVRSLRALADSDLGYDWQRMVVARIDLRAAGIEERELQPLYRRLVERVQAEPGVQSASLSQVGLLNNSTRAGGIGWVEGYTRPAGVSLQTNEEAVTTDYFRTTGLRLVQGRLFGREEANPKGRSSIVNQTFARRFFGRENPIGKRWSYDDTPGENAFTIVGVVEDARYRELRGEMPNMAYLPVTQTSEYLSNLEARTSGDPATLVSAVRRATLEVDSRIPVEAGTMAQRLTRQLSESRLVAQLTTAFGAIALLLACLGLYGTISYGVTRRSGELGVRMALGADRRTLQWMVMKEALTLVAVGAAVGVPLALLAGRSVTSLLFGVRPLDATAYAVAAAALLGVAAVAAYLPARRASRTDPMSALRTQ